MQWTFTGNPYEGFTIYNKAAGSDKILGSASGTTGTKYNKAAHCSMAAPNTRASEKFFINEAAGNFCIADASGYELNVRTDNSYLAYYNAYANASDAQANVFVAQLVVSQATVTYVVNDEGGTEIARYENIAVDEGVEINELPAAYRKPFMAYTYSAPITPVAGQSYTFTATEAGYNLPFEVSTANRVVWYNLKAAGMYFYKSGDGAKFSATATKGTEDKYLFAFYGDPTNGFTIRTLNNQYVNVVLVGDTWSAGATASDTPSTFAIEEAESGFRLSTPDVTYPERVLYLGYANTVWTANGSKLLGWGSLRTSNEGLLSVEYVRTDEVVDVTYVVKDTDDNTLYTSAPVATPVGANITTLPSEYQRSAFYTYDEKNTTVSATNTTFVYTATLKADAPVKFTTDATDPYYYNLKIRGKYLVRANDNSVPNQDASEPFNPAASWAFIGTPYDGFSVINQQAGSNLFLMYSALHDDNGTSWGKANIVTLCDDGTHKWILENNTGGFVLRAKENTNVYLHQRNVNGLSTCSVTEWSAVHNDAGSTIVASTDEQVLIDLYTAMNSISVGEGPNKYSVTGMTLSEFQTEMTNIGTVISNQQTSEYATSYNTLLGLQNAFTLNLPAAGFYRIKGNTSGKYLAEGKASNGKFSMTDATDNTTLFCFDGSSLVNYETALANGMNKDAWAWVNGDDASAISTVSFVDGNTNGGYGILSKNAYLYDNGDNSDSADRGSNASMTSDNPRYRSWYLEVAEAPLTLTDCSNYGVDGYYTTMYLPVNVTVTGAKVYTVNDGVGNSLDVEELTDGFVPANTGVVLEGTSASATATVSTATGTVTSVLTGTAPVMSYDPANENVYVLSVANSKLGFYKFAGTELKGFRAYYQTTGGGSSTRGFVLNFGGTATGINAATLNANGNAYDLQGRRVNNAQKGVFIINGKKVVK